MDSEQCQIVKAKKLNIKIVLPHWFDDCLKLGKRINEAPYMLPDPEILRANPEDPLRVFENRDIRGATSPDPIPGELPTPNQSPRSNRRDFNVFAGKNVMLSAELGLRPHLIGSLEDLIRQGGGSMTGSVHKADIYICRYREGKDYKIASRKGKDVGSLPWLYHVITHNAWTSPMKRVLHYPVARNGLPGFSKLKISLSNYSGEARIYLENLIKATGAEATKTMKQDNTHLITAHDYSEKCQAAREWNIHMVNHLWLEESYAKWQMQSLTNPRYTHFPPRTNLGEVVGQTKIDRDAVERVFFPIEDEAADEESDAPEAPTPTVALKGQVPESSVPTASKEAPPAATNRNGDTPQPPKEKRRHSEGANLKTPAPPRFTSEGQNGETPSTTGSRKARDAAAQKLQNMAPDIALYEKERKRVGGVVYGGKRNSDPKEGSKKRALTKEDESVTDAAEEHGSKKVKTSKSGKPPIQMHLLVSGYKKWVERPRDEDRDKVLQLPKH